MGKHKAQELKKLAEYVKQKHEKQAKDLNNLQKYKKIQTRVWAASELILGPKHNPIERTAIYKPTTEDLLTHPNKIIKVTLKFKI